MVDWCKGVRMWRYVWAPPYGRLRWPRGRREVLCPLQCLLTAWCIGELVGEGGPQAAPMMAAARGVRPMMVLTGEAYDGHHRGGARGQDVVGVDGEGDPEERGS